MSLVAPEVPGYELASHYEAAREVGGDFFDLFRMRRRGRPLSVVIADVSGKGIAAALLMAFSRPLLHAAVDNTAGPAEALERTNRILVQERRSSLFITALCATLALPTGRLRLANAGHEPPLIIPGDGSPILPVDVEGPLLGAFGSLGLFEAEVELGGGDVVLFYTDGVTDARSATGERFEEERLLAAIEAARGDTRATDAAPPPGSSSRSGRRSRTSRRAWRRPTTSRSWRSDGAGRATRRGRLPRAVRRPDARGLDLRRPAGEDPQRGKHQGLDQRPADERDERSDVEDGALVRADLVERKHAAERLDERVGHAQDERDHVVAGVGDQDQQHDAAGSAGPAGRRR